MKAAWAMLTRLTLLLACSGLSLAAGRGPTPVTPLDVSPRTLSVGMFSASNQVRITGRVREDAGVVVVVRGQNVTETLVRKGRFGFIWVNAGRVEVSGAPALSLTFAPQPLDSLLSRPAIDRFGLDERALLAGVTVTPRSADTPEIRDSYLRLKVDDGSFRSSREGLDIGSSSGGQRAFVLALAWPATAPPGRYTATAYACLDREVVGSSSASFEIVESGMAAGLKHLAGDHGAIYGVLAVGITLSVGFGLDFGLAWVRRRRSASRRRRSEALMREDVGVH